MIKLLNIICIIFLLSSVSAMAADTTLVRITTDIDNARIFLNDAEQQLDDFGNPALKNSSFILKLLAGDYNLKVYVTDSLLTDTLLQIAGEEVISLDFNYEIAGQVIDTAQAVSVTILSEPDSASIFFNNEYYQNPTPATFWSPPDSVQIEVVKEGYEPLMSSFMLQVESEFKALFKLRRLPPSQLTADSLGLIYLKEKPPLDIEEANKIMDRYRGLSESFIIFPLAQGLLAKLVVEDDLQKEANVMVLSGVALTIGSFIIGKISSSKKRKHIITSNEIITRENEEARGNNNEIDKELRILNKKRMDAWEAENEEVGQVEIMSE